MKLLQWNVWYQEDIDNILRTIEAVEPDMLCLQELTTNFAPQKRRHTAEYLARALGMHCFFKAARETVDADGTHAFGNAILTRHPIVKTTSHLIRRPSPGAEIAGGLAPEARVYLEATLGVGEKRLVVGTTHMSYTRRFWQTAAKRAEADKLVAVLQKKKRRFVISGDFNSLPNSYTIRAIRRLLTHTGPPYTESTWTTKPFSYSGFVNTLNWRIDYCFATPDIRVTSARVVATPYSDHLPLLVEFDL